MSSIQFLIGKTLGKYEILEHIGHGGMAEVYKGRQRQLNRMVAIKILHPFLADEEGFVARFRREAHIVATMRHPNIVQVYDFDYDETLDIYYMVMEYIEGPTLKDRLENGPLTISETLEIGVSIADALDYAHGQSMVHRDIKPANIMFLPTGSPVLTDFGIARMLTLSGLTASGAMVGTPAYMAPEIAMGKPAGPASDLYSLSVVLYQTVTGQLPFSAETPMGMVMQHINQAPLPPSRHVPAIPTGLDEVILQGLAKQPTKRFADAAEMAARLRTLQRAPYASTKLTSSPIPVLQRHPPSSPSSPAPPPPQAPASEWQAASVEVEEGLEEQEPTASRSPLWLRLLLIALVVLTLGAALVLQSGITPMSSESAALTSPTMLESQARATGQAAMATPTPFKAATTTLTATEERAALPPATAQPSPTPVCNLRVKTDLVRVEPASTVSPGSLLLTYISLRNTGKCAWPSDMRLRFAEGNALGAQESFPLKPLPPRQNIQVVIPMTAPLELGTYQSVWIVTSGERRVGSRIPVEIKVADVPTPTPEPLPVIPPSSPTLEPLTVLTPTLVTWEDDPAHGRWQGTVRFQAQGGDGSYRYFLDVVNDETELPNGELSFEWERCRPLPVSLWVLSANDLLNWQGEIAFPAPERCP